MSTFGDTVFGDRDALDVDIGTGAGLIPNGRVAGGERADPNGVASGGRQDVSGREGIEGLRERRWVARR